MLLANQVEFKLTAIKNKLVEEVLELIEGDLVEGFLDFFLGGEGVSMITELFCQPHCLFVLRGISKWHLFCIKLFNSIKFLNIEFFDFLLQLIEEYLNLLTHFGWNRLT